jgi:acetoin utilization protein AcuB
MVQHGIRHLAVTDGERAVGVLSERDIYHWRTVKAGVEAEVLAVFEAMSSEPFSVAVTDPLAKVAAEMALRRVGAALVFDGPQLAGIFTTSDALRALAAGAEATHA